MNQIKAVQIDVWEIDFDLVWNSKRLIRFGLYRCSCCSTTQFRVLSLALEKKTDPQNLKPTIEMKIYQSDRFMNKWNGLIFEILSIEKKH